MRQGVSRAQLTPNKVVTGTGLPVCWLFRAARAQQRGGSLRPLRRARTGGSSGRDTAAQRGALVLLRMIFGRLPVWSFSVSSKNCMVS